MESIDYVGILGKGLTAYLTLRTKSPDKKQNARTPITDIINQDLWKLLKEFDDSPYLGYKKKQFHNEPTGDYLFLIKNMYKLVKINKHVWIRNKRVKLGVYRKMCKQNNLSRQ